LILLLLVLAYKPSGLFGKSAIKKVWWWNWSPIYRY
jgi:hypothetical protein